MTSRGLLIGDLIRRNAAARPNAPAASLAARVLTHRELDRLSNQYAQLLYARGLRVGDRVVSWADSSLEVIVLFAALSKLGAVFAPLNARASAGEVAPVAALARPALILCDERRLADARELARSLGFEAQLLVGGATSLADLAALASAEDLASTEVSEADPQVLFFTSGSSGTPKGVVLSHRANWLRAFQGVFQDDPEVCVCMFPLFHMAAFTLALAAWQTGGEIALCERAEAELLLETMQQRRATKFYGLPAVWARILDADIERFDLQALRFADTGTSAVPPELVAELKERLPHTATRIYYGSTEAGAGTGLPDRDALRKPGSVGPPVPGVELRLAEDGEVRLRSPFMMDGYFENEAATRESLKEGWYQTGDLGALDEDGFLSIVGRKRDVIRTGGETVAPSEVEAALAGHPDIAEVAVVGLPDAKWGERVCAVVVPREGLSAGALPSLEALRTHVADRLARFKQPRELVCVEALPRTAATRQIQRTLLVERLVAQGLRGELRTSEEKNS